MCYDPAPPPPRSEPRSSTRYKATWKREFKLPWREAGPPNHLDDVVDADQLVVDKELALSLVPTRRESLASHVYWWHVVDCVSMKFFSVLMSPGGVLMNSDSVLVNPDHVLMNGGSFRQEFRS